MLCNPVISLVSRLQSESLENCFAITIIPIIYDMVNYLLTSLVIVSYFATAVCWLDLIRTFPIAKQGARRNTTKMMPNKQNAGCRKDRQCPSNQFCNRYERTCLTCRVEGQTCRRNKMCCRGMECAGGKCRQKFKLGIHGALCTKDRDCSYGFCCAREKGQSVCKKMLQEGNRCSMPHTGMYLWSHQCPCAYGLKCRRRRRALDKILDLIRDWNDETERKCVRSHKT